MSALAAPRAHIAAANGYWTPRRMEIWRRLTPEQRDHDRYVGWFPPGDGAYETDGAQRAEDDGQYERHECRCHINPPCIHCTDCAECFQDGAL